MHLETSDRSLHRTPVQLVRGAALTVLALLALAAPVGADAASTEPEVPIATITSTPEPSPTSSQAALLDAVRRRALPSVVSILSVRETHVNGRASLQRSGGSGTVISAEGHVVTNAHVTLDSTRFRLVFADKREIHAQLVGEDPLSDIAVLQYDPGALEGEPIAVATFGDSAALRPGDLVVAIGAPWGLSHSLSVGAVNNAERVFVSLFDDDADYETALGRDQPTASYYRWIQHDAPISPGNSGGPLVNLAGEVVGVNTRGNVFGGDMAFASPSLVVEDVVEQLIDYGEVRRSWLGLKFKPVRTTPYDHGVLVNSVIESSPAARAGIEPGDLVVAVDGAPVNVIHAEDLPAFRRNLSVREIGSQVDLQIERDGVTLDVRVETERYQRDRGERLVIRDWGLTVEDLTPRMARGRRLPDHRGVVVTSLDATGPAAEATPSLSYDDRILKIDDTELTSIDDLEAWLEEHEDDDAQPIVTFERAAAHYIVALDVSKSRRSRPAELPDAWLPVEVQPLLPDLADDLGFGPTPGYRIARVYDHPAAGDIDLHVDDLLTAINDDPIEPRTSSDVDSYNRRVRSLEPGQLAGIDLIRNGEPMQVEITLLETPQSDGEVERETNRAFGFSVRDLTFFDKARRRWPNGTEGVLVTDVEEGGWAGLGHLRGGDLLQAVDSTPCPDVETFKRLMQELEETQSEKVVLSILRGVETRFIFVDTNW